MKELKIQYPSFDIPVPEKTETEHARNTSYRTLQNFLASAARVFVRLATRVEVVGKENLAAAAGGPLLIISNHKSFLDPILIGSCFPEGSNVFPLRFIAKDQFFANPIKKFFFQHLGAFPALKGSGIEQSLSVPVDILNHGGTVVFFPEGKRIKGPEIGEGKIGAAILALKFPNLNILPIAISGAHKIGSWGLLYKRPRLKVHIGKPFTLAEKEAPLQAEKVLTLFMDTIKSLYLAVQQSHKHMPNKLLKFLSNTISDFYKIYTPMPKTASGRGYAFIVHPRGYGDIVGNLPFLKILPRNFVMKYFTLLWPFTVSKISGLKALGNGEDIPGWVIGVPMLPHQMMENRLLARKKIAQAVKLASRKGAKVVGLGALTGSVTEGGAGMSKQGHVTVTAGRAYTTYVIKSYAEDAIKKFGLAKENVTVAIVGAAGGVGTGVVRILAREPFKKLLLIDVERKLERVRQVIGEYMPEKTELEITHQIGRVKEADILITVTNAPEAVVESDDVKPGAIIIDDAQPSDLSPELLNNRNDIVIVEAGVISAPGIHVGANFRLANRHETYCCLGEVMCIAASDWEGEYEPGNITPKLVESISAIAEKIGFKLAPYQAFGKLVSEPQIEEVRKILNGHNAQ